MRDLVAVITVDGEEVEVEFDADPIAGEPMRMRGADGHGYPGRDAWAEVTDVRRRDRKWIDFCDIDPENMRKMEEIAAGESHA